MLEEQTQILKNNNLIQIQSLINDLVNHRRLPSDLSNPQLLDCLRAANFCYRAGFPFIDDNTYDHIWFAELERRAIESEFKQKIEPEPAQQIGVDMLPLPMRMLSLEKAYTMVQIGHFLARIEKKAAAIGVKVPENYLITPKLDGFAALDLGGKLYTRGNGEYGHDISYVFDRGLQIYKQQPRGLGAGEIVTEHSFFESVLKSHFSHPRNFTASILREKALDPLGKQALLEAKSVFVPFVALPQQKISHSQLMNHEYLSARLHSMSQTVPFLTDGLVIFVPPTHNTLKSALGHTEKNHRWQIAYKQNAKPLQTTVVDVKYQISKQGRMTPVLEFEPIVVSGARLTRCTAHHCGMLRKGLGKGAVIEVVRSGEIIPKLVNVIKTQAASIPHACPSCHQPLMWEDDFLYCNNHAGCQAQIVEGICYFFSKISSVKGFGKATIEKLYQSGVRSISETYKIDLSILKQSGLGPKQSENLLNAIEKSKHTPIENYRFLSAFGISNLGISIARRLLDGRTVSDLFALREEDILKHEGIAHLTAHKIYAQLQARRHDILSIAAQFNLIERSSAQNQTQVVLTGIFEQKRSALEKQLAQLGFICQSQVSKQTHCVLAGDKPGASKLKKAHSVGVKVLDEPAFCAQYVFAAHIFQKKQTT